MSGDRWLVGPFTPVELARVERNYRQRLEISKRNGDLFPPDDAKRQKRRDAEADVAVEIAYRRELPAWVHVKGPGSWDLVVGRDEPDDHAYVHVWGRKDGRYLIDGWLWGCEAKREGVMRMSRGPRSAAYYVAMTKPPVHEPEDLEPFLRSGLRPPVPAPREVTG